MIIGTSRAAQGLQPEVFQPILSEDIYNYAFTVSHSPFGEVYYNSIKRKHNKQTGGLFIVTIDPWSISSSCMPVNAQNEFREKGKFVDKTTVVDLNPNIFYLLNSFSGNYLDVLIGKKSHVFLHNDGWLEVKGIPMDSASMAQRRKKKLAAYRNNKLPNYNFSSTRLDYLIKTVTYLKQYGDVYLVRLPVHESMLSIENELMPRFDDKISKAIQLADGYLDMTPNNMNYIFTDGNHLHKSSGVHASKAIANWILRRKELKNVASKHTIRSK